MSRAVIVVLPGYNAERTLSPVVRGLRTILPDAIIIGVNDGSTDGTGALQEELRSRPAPDGARGWHSVTVFVDQPS